MNIKPIGPRVLLKSIKHEEKTKGGIYIPDSAKEDRKEGIVAAVGTFPNGTPLNLNIGDKILYGGYTADEFEHNSQKYKMIEYKDVLAKFE